MKCHDPVGLKFLSIVYGDVAAYEWTKKCAYGTRNTWDYFQPNRVTVQIVSLFKPRGQTVSLFKPRSQVIVQTAWSNRVLLTDDMAQS